MAIESELPTYLTASRWARLKEKSPSLSQGRVVPLVGGPGERLLGGLGQGKNQDFITSKTISTARANPRTNLPGVKRLGSNHASKPGATNTNTSDGQC